MDRMIREEWRRDLLNLAFGTVLEAGGGTGANLNSYPGSIESLTGVDFSSEMLKYAKQKVSRLNVPYNIEIIEADIQELPFSDHTFDTIVSTCVFCSVPGLEISMILDKNLPSLYGDVHRMEQVFYNLIENGIKYSVEGSITLRSFLRKGLIVIEVSGFFMLFFFKFIY